MQSCIYNIVKYMQNSEAYARSLILHQLHKLLISLDIDQIEDHTIQHNIVTSGSNMLYMYESIFCMHGSALRPLSMHARSSVQCQPDPAMCIHYIHTCTGLHPAYDLGQLSIGCAYTELT